MVKTTFRISKMDCPSEEQMIRARLEGMNNIKSLKFDIPGRLLEVYHLNGCEGFLAALENLHLDTKLISSETTEDVDIGGEHRLQRHVLWQVLVINFFFFALEIAFGLIAGSMGLVADSLDMLADSIVYGLSLFAVGGTVVLKKRIAGIAGYFQ
ncbi:MAG TPA: cation transporter, partial [Syntrophorhabdus sp.]|nr:cation transporter [Syntrophorhabdus sp.]